MQKKNLGKDKLKNPKRSFFSCGFIFFLFIGFSLLTLFLLWKFIIRPYWQEVLFYTYISIGILLGFVTIISNLVIIKKKATNKHVLLKEIIKVFGDKNPIRRIRSFLDSLLEFFWSLTAWPANFYREIYQIYRNFKHKHFLSPLKTSFSKIDFTSFKAESSLTSYDLVTAITILVNILIVYSINYLLSTPWSYSIPFLLIMVVHILCRHLTYAISSITLPQKLRQTYGNPYLRFVAIGLTDLLILLLSFALIISIENSIPMTFTLFKQVAMEMLKFKRIQNITDFRNIAFIEIIISMAGILYYFTLLKAMIRFKEFKRIDDDYRIFAVKFIFAGKFDKSLNYLKKVQRININDFAIKIACLVGINQINKAFDSAENYLKISEEQATKDDVFSFVLESTTLYNVPKEYYLNAIKRGISSSISESRLYSIISTALKKFDPPPYEDFENLFKNPKIKDSYPLSYSDILISLGRYKEAFTIISKIDPKSDVDRLIHHLLWIILQGQISEMAHSQKIIEIFFLEFRLTEIFKIARRFSFSADWEKSFVFTILMSVLVIVKELAPNREQECHNIMKEIKNSLKDSTLAKKKIEFLEKMFGFLSNWANTEEVK